MPRLLSGNKMDKQIPKGPYWDYLRQKMKEAGISSDVYNLEIQRDAKSKMPAAPFYGDLFRVCRLAGVLGGEVFKAIGIDLRLSDEDREFLELAEKIPDGALEKVMTHAQIMDWGWYKKTMDAYTASPYNRLRSYFVHASPPITENQLEYRFKTIAQLNADALERGLAEPTTEDMAKYYIAKVTSSHTGLAFPIEIIPCVAEMCGVSIRWLCGYGDQDSFFGYKPLAEQLYDFWKVHNDTNRYIITKTLLNIQERM